MKKIFQQEYSLTRGDCQRACVASVFELEIEQVPHFRLYDDNAKVFDCNLWWSVYCGFIWSMGWEVLGTGSPDKNKLSDHTINGLILACVPIQDGNRPPHAVIIDSKGVVVHDPDKQQFWLGQNVLESGDLDSWDIIKKREAVG